MVEHYCAVGFSDVRVADRRPSTGSGLTDFCVRGDEDAKPRSTKTSTFPQTVNTDLVEVCLSALCVIDRRPSTCSGLTEFFVRVGEDINPRSIQTSTFNQTVNTELVEVCLSALRVADRRPSTGSGLTDVVVRGMEDINPRSTTTATKPVRPEPVEGLSFFRKTEQRSNTLTRAIFTPNSLLTGVSD